MNRFTATATILTLLAPAGINGQSAFEGTIKAVMTAAGQEVQVEQHVRGNMARQDLAMPGGTGAMSMITDAESGKTIMLMHAQKMWMDMAAMSQMMGNMGRGRGQGQTTPATALPEIQRTDRTETIAGHECRHYIVASASGEIDICAASGMGFYMPSSGPTASPMGGRGQAAGMPDLPANAALWAKEFSDGFFPLSVTGSAGGGFSWVVREVERKRLSDELFKPPADYNEMKLPGRGGG